jgi:hypothetical protein
MSLCQYKDIFGAPGTGLHSYRIFNMAAVDLFATALGAYVLSIYYTRYGFIGWMIILILVSIVVHYMFCVETTLTKLLSIN